MSTMPSPARVGDDLGRPCKVKVFDLATAREVAVDVAFWPNSESIVRPCRAATAEVPETEDNIEGPFYKPGAPIRSVLLQKGMRGTPLCVEGRILDTRGQPLKGALLDIWHANDSGEYDNKGFTLRGRTYTDDLGGYRLLTIKPRPYGVDGDFRPAHIHVKASAPGFPLLTTQLYFKGDRTTVARTRRRGSRNSVQNPRNSRSVGRRLGARWREPLQNQELLSEHSLTNIGSSCFARRGTTSGVRFQGCRVLLDE